MKRSFRHPGTARSGRRQARPRVEALEERLAPAHYTVTTLADDDNGMGVGGVSLREALLAGGADTIDFAVTGTINLQSALPDVTGSLRILGPGAGDLTVRRDAASSFRIFNVVAGSDVEIAGLTIQNGNHSSESGGGVASTNARLTLTDCVLEDNRAFGNGGGLFFLGDGANTLTIRGCTFRGNTGETNGSGAWVASTTDSRAITVTVSNSAFLGNNDGTGGPVGGLALIGGPGSAFTLTNTAFADNLSRLGSAGGLQIVTSGPSTVTVADCAFLRNRGIHGGGMNVGGNANLSVTDCLFEGNVQTGAGNGGGLSVAMSPLFEGSIDVRRTRFLGNSSSFIGGGMAVTNGPTTFITDCTFDSNAAPTEGGGLYVAHAVSILRSTFHGNAAGRDGGGLYAPGEFGLPSTITNSTFSNNSAGDEGGGLYATTNYTITHTTITANRADSDGNGQGRGGGLQASNTTLLHHTLVAGNFVGTGSTFGDVGAGLSPNGASNLIGDSTGMATGPTHGVNGNQVGTASSPIDPMLGPLADNGGLTLTHALLPGSPALDAGNNALVTVASDQRGSPRIADSGDPDSVATVDIGAYELFQVNGSPTAGNDSASGPEDQDLILDLLSNDADPDGDPLAITALSDPPHGTVSLGPNGLLTYRGDSNYHGPDSFTYVVTDGQGHFAEAVVDVTVTPVNDAPVAVDDATSVSEDHIAAVFLLANDADPDGDPLTFDVVAPPAVGALLSFSDHVGYVPPPDFTGTVTFTYQASDGIAVSNIATVTVHVTSVNDLPLANPDEFTIEKNRALTVAAPGALGNDTDVDGDRLTAELVRGPAHGTLQLNADGSFTYTPTANYHGPDSFTYTAKDAEGLTSNVATVNLTITQPPSEGLIADPFDASKTALPINGTDGDDVLLVVPGAAGQVKLILNGVTTSAPRPSGRLLIDVGAGNDIVLVALFPTLPALIHGGSGHDTIFAGYGNDLAFGDEGNDVVYGQGGDDVLVGGGGSDVLFGQSGNDLLIGGGGADALFGGPGGDVLIGSRTAFDASAIALLAIQKEWSSCRPYEARVANLRGEGTGARLNGDFFLKATGPEATVFADAEADRLRGKGGRDWFFADFADLLLGRRDDELLGLL